MRFNFFGGPGAGKSTMAAEVFSELKRRTYSVELVGEYVKPWAYAQKPVHKFDQLYILGKQIHAEYQYLTNGVQNIITDSPVALAIFYAQPALKTPLSYLVEEYERDYPSFNILLRRDKKPYVAAGRYQTEDEARQADEGIRRMLISLGIKFVELPFGGQDDILKHVLVRIEGPRYA